MANFSFIRILKLLSIQTAFLRLSISHPLHSRLMDGRSRRIWMKLLASDEWCGSGFGLRVLGRVTRPIFDALSAQMVERLLYIPDHILEEIQ